ncbi:MAG: Cytosolic iron-sulfur protein assembly protein [Claussenomyces sp. TS43310]|nr:MAG: Cytosolic iron-sulfur protein assembly protein [Claussenomyces sp. TS43310]
MRLTPLPPFTPPSKTRAWVSIPHPSLPLLATASSDKSVRIYSLQSHQLHSTLEGGHKRSVRSIAWKPNLPGPNVCLVTGSFDATAGIWRRSEDVQSSDTRGEYDGLEIDVMGNDGDDEEEDPQGWEFSLVLEGHDSEIKSVAFSPSGQFLATCSRDKSVWIWEEIGVEGEDEWETIAVLQEHEGDVKAVAWCGDQGGLGQNGGEILASASYDDTIRLWREDGEGEWGCVAVLTAHDGTVWSVDWENPLRHAATANGDTEETDGDVPRPPARLITSSADSTIKVWRTTSPVTNEPRPASNGIPSTMRPAPSGETWICEATLPKAHDRAIYSASWSKKTGRVVSTGSDSRVVIYEERPRSSAMVDGAEDGSGTEAGTEWHVLATLEQGHGPYEINHVTWCPRYDGGRKGEEEMVITTGDDGKVKAWALES